ncbi:MAG: pyridoxamine 5'-phosphate oxidase family protein [Candidatus Marinimicrobia bacterium]|nr:pyridoxamine 5'-phosphate oxidase family protein [Candidatus Neomarinimicrobiota bacterium]
MDSQYDSNNKNRSYRLSIPIWLIICMLGIIGAQETISPTHSRDSLLTAARELMEASQYCALITIDDTGHPQARTMFPFPPDDNMVVWFGTNVNSRKVKEISHDPRVTLYYEAPRGNGYVTIRGLAELTNDPTEKANHFMTSWEEFYPDRSMFIPFKVIPERLEIVSYPHQIIGDTLTWAAPDVTFPTK